MSFIGWLDNEVFKEFHEALEPIRKRKKIIFFLIILAVIGLMLGQVNKTLLFIPLLVILASVSMIYNIWTRISIGVELVMLATVLCSVVYGPIVGVMVGFVSLLFAEIISTMLSYNTFISFIGIIVVGFVASFHDGGNIAMWGISMTILYDLIIIPGYLVMGSNPVRSSIYVLTHIPFNIIVFTKLAPSLLEAML